MSSWFSRAFGYGLGASVGRAIFGDEPKKNNEPIRPKTEEEIRADEARYDEEAKQYDAAERAKKP